MKAIQKILNGVVKENSELLSNTNIQYLARGSRNFVYSAGNKVIKLGYGKNEYGCHAVEAWFYDVCSNQNNFPKVYDRGMIYETPYMILDNAGAEIQKGTEEIGSKFGDIFRQIHKIDVTGVSGVGLLYHSDGEIKGKFSSNEEQKSVYMDILNAGTKDIKARKLISCPEELSDLVGAISDKDILKINASLTFHDWNQKNFLENDGTFMLIDPMPVIEDPLIDNARLELFCDINPKEALFNPAFLKGFTSAYFENGVKSREEQDKIDAYKLFFLLARFYENELSGKREISGKNNKYRHLIERYVLNSALID